MTNCQGGDLIAVTEKEWVSTDNKHTGSQLYHRRKDRVEVALGAGMYDMELQPELAGRRLQVSRLALGTGKGRVEERGRDGRCRHQLVQHLHLLLHQLHAQVGHARDVAAWSVETSNKSNRDRVDRYGEDDRKGRGLGLCRECRRRPSRDNQGHLTSNQLRRQGTQSIASTLSPAVFDRHVLALDEANFLQSLLKRSRHGRVHAGRLAVEETDDRHRRLLRPCASRLSREQQTAASDQSNEL